MKNPDEIRQALTASDGGTLLTIEVSTGSRAEGFPTGYNPWRQAVGIHVKAHAVEGRANKAIIALIAETLKIPRSSIEIVSGQTSSMKRIFIKGLSPDSIHLSLASLLS